MKYVALLRGINVGGKNKIEMKKLKSAVESIGYHRVSTYINSGNIIFESTVDSHNAQEAIERRIQKDFNLSIPVVVKDFQTISKIVEYVPETWTNDSSMKTDVLFLWEEVNNKHVLDRLTIKRGIDNVKYLDGAVVWNVKREEMTKSGLLKIVGTDLYKKMTVRNINTVNKLYNLMRR